MDERDSEDDEAAVRELDDAWNDVYLRNDRASFAAILADDFIGFFADGRTISKAQLMTPSEKLPVAFSERSIHVFGSTAVTRGRIRVERPEGAVEQRFMRIYSKRHQRWRAVAVQVLPIVELP